MDANKPQLTAYAYSSGSDNEYQSDEETEIIKSKSESSDDVEKQNSQNDEDSKIEDNMDYENDDSSFKNISDSENGDDLLTELVDATSEIMTEPVKNEINSGPFIFWDNSGPVWSLASSLKKLAKENAFSLEEKNILTKLPKTKRLCSDVLQKKFRHLYDLKQKEHSNEQQKDFNSMITDNKAFRNPSIYEKLLQYCDIDDSGTNCPPTTDFINPSYNTNFDNESASEDPNSPTSRNSQIKKLGYGIYNTKRSTGKRLWGNASFYEELAKTQKTEMEKWEKDRLLKATNAANAACLAHSSQQKQQSSLSQETINSKLNTKIIETTASQSHHIKTDLTIEHHTSGKKFVSLEATSRNSQKTNSPQKSNDEKSTTKNTHRSHSRDPITVDKIRKTKWG